MVVVEEGEEEWAKGERDRRMQVRKQREAVSLSDAAKCVTPCGKKEKKGKPKEKGKGANACRFVFLSLLFSLFFVLPLQSALSSTVMYKMTVGKESAQNL